jgi:hypothetical protein
MVVRLTPHQIRYDTVGMVVDYAQRLGKRLCSPISIREQGRWKWPGDRKLRVIEGNGDVFARVVRAVDPMGDVSRIGKCLETVRTSGWDIDRLTGIAPQPKRLHLENVGDPGRRSTTTSNISPYEQRTIFASPLPGRR